MQVMSSIERVLVLVAWVLHYITFLLNFLSIGGNWKFLSFQLCYVSPRYFSWRHPKISKALILDLTQAETEWKTGSLLQLWSSVSGFKFWQTLSHP